ncbi:hypothetical protein BJY00DRAFT_308912 [Aspergillus carlsbadensis]|nr:hypothetical protein BJY00DRAFT_308912 [Aspergillus carlsbadensis]
MIQPQPHHTNRLQQYLNHVLPSTSHPFINIQTPPNLNPTPERKLSKMPPFTITTTGHASIARPAERGTLRLSIADSGPAPTTVSQNVIACTNMLKSLIAPLNPRSASGEITPDAKITHWSLGTLSTYSYTVADRRERKKFDKEKEKEKQKEKRIFHASTNMEVKFRDFAALSDFASDLAGIPLVDVDGVDWALTDVSKRELARRVRSLAGRDALERAEDYAGTFGKDKVLVSEVVEEGGGYGHGYGGGVVSRMRAGPGRHGGDDEGEERQGLEFRPEEVEVSAQVTVKFVTE